jgi:hypothetical protein
MLACVDLTGVDAVALSGHHRSLVDDPVVGPSVPSVVRSPGAAFLVFLALPV